MKVCLINCYSDRNSGDLGIIYGTLNYLRSYSEGMTITAVSSFSKKDPWFKTEHVELRKNIDFLHATPIGRVFGSSLLKRIVVLIREIPLMLIIWIFSGFTLKRILSGLGYSRLVSDLVSSDLIVSKGGSFLCNRNNYIDKIRLVRELTILKLSTKLNRNTVIAGQSIGPVYGVFSRIILRNVLKSTRTVIVREELCLQSYSYLFDGVNVKKGYDFAFNLSNKFIDQFECDIVDNNVIGLTLKVYPSEKQNIFYLSKLKEIVQKLVLKGFSIVIIPHVRIDDDDKQAQNLMSILDEVCDKRIKVLEQDLSINELLALYNKLVLLIGTRLHSTIFALTMGTPAINIGYHGTKAKGVYRSIGLDDWQFDLEELDSNVLIESVLHLVKQGKIDSTAVNRARKRNEEIVYGLLNSSSKK